MKGMVKMDVREKLVEVVRCNEMENEKKIIDGFALLDKILLYYTECERNGKLMHSSCEIKQKIADMVCEEPKADAAALDRG